MPEEYRPSRRYARSQPIRTADPPWALADGALHEAFGSASQARVVRSVLVRLVDEVRAGREPPVRGNLRSVGYRYLLPVWSRLPLPPTGWYVRLVREARRLATDWRALSYVELGVTDSAWEARRIGDRAPEIIAFAEDHDFVRLLRRAHAEHGITTVALSGGPSAITAEYTAAHVLQAIRTLGRADQPLRLLALTDYDPHGWDNARAFRRRLADFGLGGASLALLVRPELLDAERLARVAVPLERRGAMARVLERWMAETGGIGGQPMKIEATSIPEETLLAAVADALGAS